MLAKVFSGALVGLDAHLVEVEVDISGGLPQFERDSPASRRTADDANHVPFLPGITPHSYAACSR